MVRIKRQIKRIENKTRRQVTFSRRSTGLLKKAYELAVLCDIELALIIFSPRGKLIQYSSLSMRETIERYKRNRKEIPAPNQNIQNIQHEITSMRKQIEELEASEKKFLGRDLASCSVEEFTQLEEQLDQTVSTVRAKKIALHQQQASTETSEASDIDTGLFLGLPGSRTKTSTQIMICD